MQRRDRVKSWLANFDPAERHVAARLLTEIHTVDAHEFRRAILVLIERVVAKSEGTLLLLPARKTTDKLAQAIFTSPFDREQEVVVVDPEQDSGSESLIGQFLRDAAKGGDDFLVAPISLKDLRESKVRHVIVVDDVIGSGRRLTRYIEELFAHPTMRSWRSFGWTRTAVVTYAATRSGFDSVMSLPQVDLVESAIKCRTIHEDLQGAWQDPVITFCERYAARSFRRGHRGLHPLGYLNAGTLLAFAHGVPNTSPAVLWQEFGPTWTNGMWAPLAPNRVMPPDLLPAGAGHLTRSHSHLRPISGSLTRTHAPAVLLLVLEAIAAGARTAQEIRHHTQFETAAIEQSLGSLIKLRFVRDSDLEPTRAGLEELSGVRRHPIPRSWDHSSVSGSVTPDSYYPSSLSGR